METKQIAKRIRALRKLKRLTQQQLADRLDISISVLGSIERGTRLPEARLLQRIAKILAVDLTEIDPQVKNEQTRDLL